jgi:hypothetical protein
VDGRLPDLLPLQDLKKMKDNFPFFFYLKEGRILLTCTGCCFSSAVGGKEENGGEARTKDQTQQIFFFSSNKGKR